MAGETDIKIIPPMARVKNAGLGALGGAAGGLAVVIGTALLGPKLGPIIGGLLGGAVIGGEVGRIVAVNGAMDSVILTLASRE